MELYQLVLTPTHGLIDKKHHGVNLAAHSFVMTIGSVALVLGILVFLVFL